jgi:protein TonB
MFETRKVAKSVAVTAGCLGLLLAWASAASAQADGTVVSMADLTTPPALASAQQAATLIQQSYPDRLQRRGIGGEVVLEFVIGADGKVEESTVEVVSASISGLADAAKSVIGRVRFTPGKVNGQPVRTQIQFPIEYRAEGT